MDIGYAVFELVFSTVLFAKGLLFIPQIQRICQRKDAAALSLTTFLSMNLMQILTIIHAVLRHDWVMVSGVGLSLLTSGTVTILTIYYRWVKHD